MKKLDTNVRGLTRVAIWSGKPEDVWAERVNQNDVPATERPCLAHGCPLLGTFTFSVVNSNSAQWFCRYHSGARADAWGEISRKLRLEMDPYARDRQPGEEG